MKFKVQVEEFVFYINVGQGLNDFAWFALAAAKLYSNKKNPDSNYLPCYLQFRVPGTDMFLTPPPRAKIFDYLKEDEEGKETLVQVEIRKGQGWIMTDQQEKWYDEAFGKMRNQFTATFQLAPLNQKVVNRQEPTYLIQYEYKMFPEVMHEFDTKNYPSKDKIIMKEIKAGDNFKKYFAEITLPLGQFTFQFYGQIITEKEGQEPQQSIFPLDMKNFDHTARLNPVPISQQEIQKKIMEYAQQKEKDLQQQQIQKREDSQKNKQSAAEECPYKFEKLWTIIQKNAEGNLELKDLEENFYNKIAAYMDDKLPLLYEVFRQYAILYNTDHAKKDEISISFQDVMHFLKFYGLVQDSQELFSFVETYDKQGTKSKDVRKSLELSVKFQEFFVIIVELAQFKKTNNLSEVESQDQLVMKIVDKIIEINSDEKEFNNFQQHMKYNEILVNFIREIQDQMQNIFIKRFSQGNDDNSDIKFHIRQEEIKQLIQDSGYKGDNLDGIIKTAYKELFHDEKFNGFEGLFYYEFIQVMQWLALVLIQNDERSQQEEAEEVTTLDQLQEQLRYFIQCIEK
ncbi:unnamed protein product [Paramecium octaurelia]|uniref:Uncharacterized protein n=1 Tax=Paramecium octaurelia TaxID=43137 RepID=A0A8S1XKY0_PAROT|nr:unnamed protein product [Paramecium octaurelia]